MTQAKLGSISSDPLQTAALLEAFSDALRSLIRGEEGLSEGEYTKKMVPVHRGEKLSEKDSGDWSSSEREEAELLVDETLMNALREYTPDLCYFGTRPADGVDFGFWPSGDAIREGVYDGTVLEVVDGRNAVHRGIPEHVYHVNDHGNATLYRIKLEKLWSVV
ncbi:hypothetical protein LCGC14_2748060 [marine sediment metagenome]|uniref:Uncharacterized protein n=1 Tax=marine sediment metagenome TaxID=412755 RepID=A0A0F8Z2I4_9ZZZZ